MQLVWRKVCLFRKREIKSSRACIHPAPHHVYLTSSAMGWELTNSLHGLILQTCTPAREAYSWKHYACIPVSERLGRNLLPRLPRGHGWHRREGSSSTASHQAFARSMGSHMLWRTPSGHAWGHTWMSSDNKDTKIFLWNEVPSSSSQQAPGTYPGVLLKAASLPVHPCVISLLWVCFPSENSEVVVPQPSPTAFKSPGLGMRHTKWAPDSWLPNHDIASHVCKAA